MVVDVNNPLLSRIRLAVGSVIAASAAGFLFFVQQAAHSTATPQSGTASTGTASTGASSTPSASGTTSTPAATTPSSAESSDAAASSSAASAPVVTPGNTSQASNGGSNGS
jgi:cytoskeletal protein RodZ